MRAEGKPPATISFIADQGTGGTARRLEWRDRERREVSAPRAGQAMSDRS
jgi:hypothetical protein